MKKAEKQWLIINGPNGPKKLGYFFENKFPWELFTPTEKLTFEDEQQLRVWLEEQGAKPK